MPHSGCDDDVALCNNRAGKTPERPSKGIPDPVWQLLQKCWSMKPPERPSATQVYNTLSKFCPNRRVIEDLPKKLRLQVQSIKISFAGAKKRRFFVKFKYWGKFHTTSLTAKSKGGDEYTWFYVSLISILTTVADPRTGTIEKLC